MKSFIYKWICLLIMFGGIALTPGSEDENDEATDDNNSTIAIAENYGGSIFFYIDCTEKRGLIAAINDQTSTESTEWVCEGTFISGTGINIGSGQFNTTAIVNGCNTHGIAAYNYDLLQLNDYSSCFFPSKDELNLMCQNFHAQGIGNFSNFLFWCSSQIDGDDVLTQNFWDDSSYFEDGGRLIYSIKAWRLSIMSHSGYLIIS